MHTIVVQEFICNPSKIVRAGISIAYVHEVEVLHLSDGGI